MGRSSNVIEGIGERLVCFWIKHTLNYVTWAWDLLVHICHRTECKSTENTEQFVTDSDSEATDRAAPDIPFNLIFETGFKMTSITSWRLIRMSIHFLAIESGHLPNVEISSNLCSYHNMSLTVTGSNVFYWLTYTACLICSTSKQSVTSQWWWWWHFPRM